MATQDKSSTLLALTSSALLLPAYHGAKADAPPANANVGVRFSHYTEDDISNSKSLTGESERYDIDVVQFHLLTPVGDDWSFALDVTREDMSGASPWFVGQSLDGNPQVIMSGASIEDTRSDVSVTTRYFYDRGNMGFNYAHSDEDDYESDALSLDASFNSADGLTTYSAALSASDDTIEPTQGVVPTKTLKDGKDMRSAWVGVSRIISRQAIVRFGLSYTYRDGFLTDPYKLNDRRPDERKERVISSGYRHFFVGPDASLHVDYRYFDDDWGISSHTIDLAWHQNLGSQLMLVPFVRYYGQEEANFFANRVDFSATDYADDYRLSSFGAFSGGVRAITKFDNWKFSMTGERYSSKGSWSLNDGDESPGLVKFWRFSVGLDSSF